MVRTKAGRGRTSHHTLDESRVAHLSLTSECRLKVLVVLQRQYSFPLTLVLVFRALGVHILNIVYREGGRNPCSLDEPIPRTVHARSGARAIQCNGMPCTILFFYHSNNGGRGTEVQSFSSFHRTC